MVKFDSHSPANVVTLLNYNSRPRGSAARKRLHDAEHKPTQSSLTPFCALKTQNLDGIRILAALSQLKWPQERRNHKTELHLTLALSTKLELGAPMSHIT